VQQQAAMPPPLRVDEDSVMRNVQNQKRMRGRNNNNRGKGHNPLTRVFESNGPDVKIRGTASHVADKYIQLARDAQASGDPVGAENYYQHAEHYFRLIAAAQEQMRQNQPQFGNRPEGINTGNDSRDGNFDDDGEDDGQIMDAGGGEQPSFGPREPQPYLPRDANFYGQGDQARQSGQTGQQTNPQQPRNDDHERLPSFITGSQPPAAAQPDHANGSYENGNGGEQRFQGERQGFRRRRRHRSGFRSETQNAQGGPTGGDEE
jgi:hypothetical protein